MAIDWLGRLTDIENALWGGGNPNGNLPALFAGVPNPISLAGSTDALPVGGGNVYVTATGVDAMTLATPASGSIVSGGQDGVSLRIRDNGGHAHTITTAANKINGNKLTATFGGTAGQYIELRAFGGVWYMWENSGITLS